MSTDLSNDPPAAAWKRSVGSAFSAADRYDDYAVIQRRTAERLAERIAGLADGGARIAEIGCGTGFLSAALGARIADAEFLATDISLEMLQRSRRRLAGDARFAFARVDADRPDGLAAHAPFDVICSNLAAQWFLDLGRSVEQLMAYLRPGGRLVFTTLCAGTFSEWRAAHARVGATPGTPEFPSAAALAALAPAGVAAEADLATWSEPFASAQAFLHALRAIGAHRSARTHRPLAAGQMRQVMRAFDAAGPQATYVVATCSLQRPG